MQRTIKKLVEKLITIEFVRLAIKEKADLSAFKQKPSVKVIVGVTLIILGSLLGWPAVAVLGILAVKFNEPLLAVVGGPLVYAFSYLVFMLGMYFSGAKYTVIFCRWLCRVIVEKLSSWVNFEVA